MLASIQLAEGEQRSYGSSLRQISTVIIAQDEEECITNAIRSCLPFADEIVVIDGGSQDATVTIAQELGCQVYHNPWRGYSEQRNFGAEKAIYDWIFFIDADEVVDQQLTTALLAWKCQPHLEANAFSALRIGDFWDKWLDTRPESHTRLYNKTVFRIKDVLVHEGPDVKDAPVIRLPGIIWHYGFRNISDLVIRFNKYTDLDAQQSHLRGDRFNWFRLLLKPPAKFVQQYLWYGMYRQGMAGFTLSVLWSYYIFLKEVKLYEIDWQMRERIKDEG
ncbi:glycosyltransferase family 2 protein [Kovacikia minuta CCNUW1]|uniref:glycosyltransferase family 2 protein n=1 Tax=Kovacikia minuta TaxID=2931930 RepID=UPI001CCD062E|nr:glycosyltransferase family 2 protein [Kovacikia minuta]UBF27177.1 glycosyltransferase family 2 protein [Kovacikia minuta CCNUW1]